MCNLAKITHCTKPPPRLTIARDIKQVVMIGGTGPAIHVASEKTSVGKADGPSRRICFLMWRSALALRLSGERALAHLLE